MQTGIAVPHISGQQIKDFKFSRPQLVEQRKLATTLDKCEEHSAQVVSIYTRKFAALDALKKSLLHHAFTGQLTSKDSSHESIENSNTSMPTSKRRTAGVSP